MAMSSGVLRYNLDGVTVRIIPGKHRFIAQVGTKLACEVNYCNLGL